jgi:hypothetical protein
MHTLLTTRLAALRAEHQAGRLRLADVDRHRQEVLETCLRLEGAIALGEELLQASAPTPDMPAGEGETPPRRVHRRTREAAGATPTRNGQAADGTSEGEPS